MKINKILTLILYALLMMAYNLNAQIGYYDAPYIRYEANEGTLTNASVTTKSFDQWQLQSEASEQICVNLSNAGASVEWPVSVAADGLVVRFSVPDGSSAVIQVIANGTNVGTLNLNTYYSWESLWNNGNPNNGGVSNQAPKMRFDEVRMKLPSKIPVGGTLKLVKQSGGNIHIDFAELEPIPTAVGSYGSVYGSGDLQTFINNNDGGGNTIFLPPGIFYVNSQLYVDAANTTFRGAGSWHTEIRFTNGSANNGGLRANANNVSFEGLYLTTDRNSRSNSYKALNGVFTSGATVKDIWAEHFECGAWIAQYSSGPAYADGFTVSNCRFRNNYADGINLCKGTRNAIVEHCNFRNNGDDDMAIWSADGMECQNNTFRYNTSENCWRASGCAIYGGYNNKAQNLLIKDNVEVGIKVNNAFSGAEFNTGGMHEFTNIEIRRCGTFYDLFNKPVGAIDLGAYNRGAGLWVRNVKFSCITIIDSKNDAIYINKADGTGFSNLVFENITINGTGREYPDNGGTGSGRGFPILFNDSPQGNATYCGMTYANRGGNAGVDVNTTEKGSLSWTAAGSCPGGCVSPSSTTITSPFTGTSYDGCLIGPITITATSIAPAGNSISNIEFFVDGVSIGTDVSSTYSAVWNSPTDGNHVLTAVAHYSGGSSSTSTPVNITVGGGIKQVAPAPVMNGTIDTQWNSYLAYNLTNGHNTSPDLAAYYKIMYDAANLYILVDVTDDDRQNNSVNSWEDDAVEIYIDIGNDKAGTYGTNDFHYTIEYNNAGTIIEGYHSPGSLTSVTTGRQDRTGGYIMEVSIPWSNLTGGGAPAAGSYMGFDIKINDDDATNGATRDNELAWNDGPSSFTAWNNPSKLGTLRFFNCSPLPVNLITFAGEKENETVVLNWATAGEYNNKKFVIERSSDLSEWETIGEVPGARNSTSVLQYSYTDGSPATGTVYYRLQQIDLDGVCTYSSVIKIESTPMLVLAPNPFEETISIHSNLKGTLTISIHDVLGRLLYQLNGKTESGTLTLQPELSAGAYLITIQSDTFIEQHKVIRK